MLDDGRGADAEEAGRHRIIAVQPAVPDLSARFQVQTVQPTLGPERHHAPTLDGRRRTGAIAFAVGVVESGRIAEVPLLLAGDGIEAFNDFPVLKPMKQDEPIAGHDGSAETRANVTLPEPLRSAAWPGG